MKYSGYNTGEMAELAEGARLLSECTVKSRTEGSNPSLSARKKRPKPEASAFFLSEGNLLLVVHWFVF